MMSNLDRTRRRELCQVLGVSLDADESTVRRKYYELARKHHPDKTAAADGQDFNKFTEAYDQLKSGYTTLNTLKNHFNKEIHSSLEHFMFTTNSASLGSFKFGSNGGEANDKNGSVEEPKSADASMQNGSGQNLSEGLSGGSGTFGSFGAFDLGGGSLTGLLATKTPKKGQTLKTSLNITFKEAIQGCKKVLEYTRTICCPECKGAKPASNRQCRECGGKGKVVACIGGSVSVTTACTTCQPQGAVGNADSQATSTCKCNGTGKLRCKKTCTVEVPPGVYKGMVKEFKGEGDEGVDGGTAGDFIVVYNVEDHPLFRRDGDNAHCTVVLPFPHAALGTRMIITSISESPLEIELESGIQHNQVVRLENQGFVNPVTGIRGDMFVQMSVDVPRQLNVSEKKLLCELSKGPHFQPANKCEIKRNGNSRSSPTTDGPPLKRPREV